jgi:hypothetical protein
MCGWRLVADLDGRGGEQFHLWTVTSTANGIRLDRQGAVWWKVFGPRRRSPVRVDRHRSSSDSSRSSRSTCWSRKACRWSSVVTRSAYPGRAGRSSGTSRGRVRSLSKVSPRSITSAAGEVMDRAGRAFHEDRVVAAGSDGQPVRLVCGMGEKSGVVQEVLDAREARRRGHLKRPGTASRRPRSGTPAARQVDRPGQRSRGPRRRTGRVLSPVAAELLTTLVEL